MDSLNSTLDSGFTLLGFSDVSPLLQIFLSILCIIIYLITLVGNLVIFVILTVDPTLHTPMYFFLRNLSVVDICLSNATIPKTLWISLSEDRRISSTGCALQMFSFFVFGITDCVLLAVMALDRYVAICIPLRYTTIMSRPTCIQLAGGSWATGILCSLGMTSLTFSLPFCKSHEIRHFFCDVPSLMKLACADTFITEVVTTAISVFVLMMPFILICITYTFIVSKIMRIRSTEGRRTAASTCASHIASVLLLYGTTMLTYVQPKSHNSMDRAFSVCYAFFTPLLNPLIYTLRNKDVKGALKKHTVRNIFSKLM
ncbi:olfactory receptor 2D2-like [Ambystoma mexicanum]|uniref:olfactory receptor 2D2-like n=1 Tax=Ambystoma mexicanum TaxID=8296 RepID=UPI0037E9ABB7